MAALDTRPNIPDPDALYVELAEAHRGLDAEASLRLFARILLLLVNHLGDAELVREAVRIARETAEEEWRRQDG